MMGSSVKGMWAFLVQEKGINVRLKTFQEWCRKGSPDYIEEFHNAVKEGQALAQHRFEKIGLDAAQGNIKAHSSGTYQFLVKNRFRADYRDEVHQTVNQQSTIRIDPSTSPQIAAQQYKDLILGSGVEQTADEFFGEDS